jgi:hypothetical protein
VLSPAQGEENKQFLVTGRNLVPKTNLDTKHHALYYRTSEFHYWIANHPTKLHQ